MIFNGLIRSTSNADAMFFPDDPYIPRTTVLGDISNENNGGDQDNLKKLKK